VKRPVKISLWVAGVITGLVILLAIAAVLILPSNWFREKVRVAIVNQVERVSGGRVEIGAFQFDWSKLTAEISPFVLHGTEPAGEKPLFAADSVQVGLKIVSALKRDIDIASLVVQRPQLNLLVDETGVTNFPKPKVERKSDRDPIEQLLNLAVQQITLRNGEIRYADKKLPLNVEGQYMNASLAYNFMGPSYEGTLNFERLTVDAGPTLPMAVAFDSKVALFKNRLQVSEARMRMRDTQVEVAGAIEDFKNLKVNFDVNVNGSLQDIGKPLRLPEPHVGNVQFKGKLTYGRDENIHIDGRMTGQGLAVKQGGISVTDIAIASDVKFHRDYVGLTGLRVDALDGRFDGMFELHKLKQFTANGKVTGLSVARISRVAGLQGGAFSGAVSGPVQLSGTVGARDLKVAGRFDVGAGLDAGEGVGGVPIKGFVEVAYDQRRESLQLGKSYLSLPSSRADFTGTLGQQLIVRLESSNLNDFTPILAAASEDAPKQLPIELKQGGLVLFTGTVTGPMQTARVAGDLTLTKFEVKEQDIDKLVATVDATSSGARIESFALGQGQLRLGGSADVGFQNWRFTDTSVIKANLKLEGAQLAKLLAEQGRKEPVDGLLSAAFTVEGTAGDPRANATITLDKPSIYGEDLDRIRAQIRYAGAGIEVIDGVAEIGTARVFVSGAYQHPVNDYKNGKLTFKASTKDLTLQVSATWKSCDRECVDTWSSRLRGSLLSGTAICCRKPSTEKSRCAN
jgi:translocation and assembly module TamB